MHPVTIQKQALIVGNGGYGLGDGRLGGGISYAGGLGGGIGLGLGKL